MMLDQLPPIPTGTGGWNGTGEPPKIESQTTTAAPLPANYAGPYTTAISNCEAIRAGFWMPGGCYAVDPDTGEMLSNSVTLSAYYRLQGAGSWTHAWTKIKTAKTRQPVRWEETVAERLTPGTYEVAFAVQNGPQDPLTEQRTVRIDYLKAGVYRDQSFPYTAWYQVLLEATEQLGSSWPNVSVLAEGRLVRVYTDTSTYTEQWSDNPAWCILDLLTNTEYGLGISHSDCDIQSFIDAAAWCTANSITLNVVLDGTKAAVDVLASIQSATMLYVVDDGVNVRLIPDTTGSAVAAFDMDNIVEGSLVYRVGSRTERLNRIMVDYLDADSDYQRQTVVIDNDAAIASDGKVREQKVSLPGVTNLEQAEKIGKLLLNYAQLARVSVEFDTQAMGLRCTPGDLISVSHDVPGWSGKLFRVLAMTIGADMRVHITALEYAPEIYDLSGLHTWTPDPVTEKVGAANVTGLAAVESDWTDANGQPQKQIDISWSNPADPNFAYVKIYLWPENGTWYEAVAGETGTSVAVKHGIAEGKTYRVAAVSVSTDGVENAIADSPQVAVTVGYITPPNVTFDASRCMFDGRQVIAAVNRLTNFSGEYEIRTSDPADWSADTTGLLGRSVSSTQVYAVADAADITLYVRARTTKGVYSATSGSITITKAEDAPIGSGDYTSTWTRNLLRNGAFLNTYVDDGGRVRFAHWDGSGGAVMVLDNESDWWYGPYALSKSTNALDMSQTVWIEKVTTASVSYALSYVSTWFDDGSRHESPVIVAEYLDDTMTQISTETFAGTAGQSGWQLNRESLTVPLNTQYIRVWIKGDALYDAMMMNVGTLWPPFELHDADKVDGIDDELERQAQAAFLAKLEGDIGDLRSRLDNIRDFWEVLNMDASVLRTQAFQIQGRAIELVAGDVASNNSRITLVENQVVIAVDANGYLANFTLGTSAYGSVATIKADQINITGTTNFYNGSDLAENINSGVSTIDGGMITANTVTVRVGMRGPVLEINSSASQILLPSYGGYPSEYVDPGVYVGCTAHSGDTDATRFRVDLDGNIWSGAVNMSSAPFSVTNQGQLTAVDAWFKSGLTIFKTLQSYTYNYLEFDADNGGLRVVEKSGSDYWTVTQTGKEMRGQKTTSRVTDWDLTTTPTVRTSWMMKWNGFLPPSNLGDSSITSPPSDSSVPVGALWVDVYAGKLYVKGATGWTLLHDFIGISEA